MAVLEIEDGVKKAKRKQLLLKSYLCPLFDFDVPVTNLYEYSFRVPDALDGYALILPTAQVITAGVTGATTISVKNGSTSMLTADISIASTATSGIGTVDASQAIVAKGDLIKVKVETLSTTAPIGLDVELKFREPS
jgi:hypothetical protein